LSSDILKHFYKESLQTAHWQYFVIAYLRSQLYNDVHVAVETNRRF